MVDLVDLSGKKKAKANKMVEEVIATHEVVRTKIAESNAKYKTTTDKHRGIKLFKENDNMIVHLYSIIHIANINNKQ